MIPVDQTRFTAHDGNCHPACIASIFEVPLDEVPQATVEELASGEGWMVYLERLNRDFLHPRGFCCVNFPVVSWEGQIVSPPGYSILNAKSPRTGGGHAVVCLEGEIIHDPHPQREMGVGEWLDWTVFIALDPSELTLPNR